MKDVQILIAIVVGAISILTATIICIKQIGKLIVKINSTEEKVDKLHSQFWTSDGMPRYVNSNDCKLHRESIERKIESTVEMAMLKMGRQIENDLKKTIARLHDRFDELRDKK